LFLIKLFSFQLARALAFLHAKGFLHRDIKPQNILVDTSTNKIFLADFGSAKKLTKSETNVAYICSRYYRAPELIFANLEYDSSTDIWSFGCLLAEMLQGKPFFQGESTVDQLVQIMKILGTPDANQLMYLNKNNALNCTFPTVKAYTVNKAFIGKPKEVISLLGKIFIYEPHKRLNALEVMSHPFFDDLRNSDLYQYSKFIYPNVFDFSENEIKLYIERNQANKDILTRIIPDWCESYRYLKRFSEE
jgi:glycogen synthase kinase 3 beta